MSENLGYQPKDLRFDQEGRDKLLSGIAKMARAVKSTLGPSGNTVIIESPHHTHGITVTKDGVTVAKSIDLLDPIENVAVKIMKQAADRTAVEAGDGTTSSIVLAEAIIENGMRALKDGSINRVEFLRRMNEFSDDVVKELKASARKVSSKTLPDVATISANNDAEIGKMIARAYKAVGANGTVTIENSMSDQTYMDTTVGIKIKRGYASNIFVNDHKRDECIFTDCKVLVCDTEISNIMQVENAIKPYISGGKVTPILIVAPCTQAVVNVLAMNVVKNGLKFCVIQPPAFGYKQHELMQDLAVAVGAKYFSEKTGDALSLIKPADLGDAKRVVCGHDSTIIVPVAEQHISEDVEERIAQLIEARAEAKKKGDRDFLSERIACLSGGVSTIYVGGATDLEQKELKDRIDDAVCAVRSAMEEGIVEGGGWALIKACSVVDVKWSLDDKHDDEISLAVRSVVGCSLEVPLRTIMSNAGIEESDIDALIFRGCGFDVKNDKFGADMFELRIIDPLKVTRCALQNAMSVATTILSTNAIVTMARTYGYE